MRKRQIENSSDDAAMRRNFCCRSSEQQPVAVLGPRVLYRRTSLHNWLEAQECRGSCGARVERPDCSTARATA
jgi:hypothetical protein